MDGALRALPAAALLVFLAAGARAGIVAAHLVRIANGFAAHDAGQIALGNLLAALLRLYMLVTPLCSLVV